jgi:hypothetical protein
MRAQTILVIVAVLSAATFAYEARRIALFAWHSGDRAIVMNVNTGR